MSSQVALCGVEVESEVKTFDENVVTDFYEIEDWKHCARSKNFPKERARRLRRFGRTHVNLAESRAAPFLSAFGDAILPQVR